mmetsp:Transcript_14990/g.49160  ORF Transcript_14990/g.49160 Transcript_14990/m.49160 type:complete len:82 (-) Transcript_14990:82-327(-)
MSRLQAPAAASQQTPEVCAKKSARLRQPCCSFVVHVGDEETWTATTTRLGAKKQAKKEKEKEERATGNCDSVPEMLTQQRE